MNRILYRPIGCGELKLIEESTMKAFPPRLNWQPIFYPVLDLEYARQIARDWNTNDELSGYAGFVTCFEISETYFQQFEIHNVGGFNHNELWVPAEELENFNKKIEGSIKVIDAFYGSQFEGEKRY